MDAREYLQQYISMQNRIKFKQSEIARIKDIACSPPSSAMCEQSGVRGSRKGDFISDTVAAYVKLEEELEQDIIKMMNVMHEICMTIELLKTTEYAVLHKIYIDGYSFGDVASMADRSYSC